MTDGAIPIGTLGPYADTNWLQVCQDGLAWFGEAHQIPVDVADTSSLDLYNDEYGMPAADATTYAQVQTEVVVREKVRIWRVRAFVKRVRSSSNYYFLECIVVHDITRADRDPVYLCTYEFEFDELDTTRSQMVRVNGRLPPRQLPMGPA